MVPARILRAGPKAVLFYAGAGIPRLPNIIVQNAIYIQNHAVKKIDAQTKSCIRNILLLLQEIFLFCIKKVL